MYREEEGDIHTRRGETLRWMLQNEYDASVKEHRCLVDSKLYNSQVDPFWKSEGRRNGAGGSGAIIPLRLLSV